MVKTVELLETGNVEPIASAALDTGHYFRSTAQPFLPRLLSPVCLCQ